MSLDPSQNAQVLASLITRCETTPPITAGRFTFAINATNRVGGDHSMQEIFNVKVSDSRVAIAWSARYRGIALPGRLLVVAANQQDIGEAAILADAIDTLNLADLRFTSIGAGSFAFGVPPWSR